MKRLIQTWMVGLVVALTPALAAAQTAVGIRAGARSAQLETAQSTDGARHLVVGGYFGIGISDRLAIQIEAVHGARGDARHTGFEVTGGFAFPLGRR